MDYERSAFAHNLNPKALSARRLDPQGKVFDRNPSKK